MKEFNSFVLLKSTSALYLANKFLFITKENLFTLSNPSISEKGSNILFATSSAKVSPLKENIITISSVFSEFCQLTSSQGSSDFFRKSQAVLIRFTTTKNKTEREKFSFNDCEPFNSFKRTFF